MDRIQLPRVKAPGFQFASGSSPTRGLDAWTDEELEERGTALALRLLDSWRGGYREERVERLLRRCVDPLGLGGLLSPQERHDLGLPT